MKKVLKILLNHSILILSSITVLLGEIILRIVAPHDLLASFVGATLIIIVPCYIIFSVAYAVFFFRKENFLTLLLYLVLIYAGKTEISAIGILYLFCCKETSICLTTLIICLFIRITAIVLIRIFKQKLQNWTGEEKITSDVVFWVKVLFKKLMKSIDPNFKV